MRSQKKRYFRDPKRMHACMYGLERDGWSPAKSPCLECQLNSPQEEGTVFLHTFQCLGSFHVSLRLQILCLHRMSVGCRDPLDADCTRIWILRVRSLYSSSINFHERSEAKAQNAETLGKDATEDLPRGLSNSLGLEA